MNKIIRSNPVLVLGIGIALLLGISHSLEVSLIYGVILVIVMILHRLLTHLLSKFVPTNILLNILIAALIVLVIGVLIRAFSYELHEKISFYLLLMIPSGLVVAPSDENTLSKSLIETIQKSVGFVIVLLVMATIREFLGTGGFNFSIMFKGSLNVIPSNYCWNFMTGPVGGFILLGIFMAILTIIYNSKEAKK